MIKKIRFILLFMSLSICLCLMNSTYSRYVADTTGNIDVLFANWQILVNNNNISDGSHSSIAFIPVIEENENTSPNTIAPSSKGYFDIDIDPSNVDVSFNYSIRLSVENENMPDLMITKYTFINEDYIEGDTLEIIDLEDNIITNTLKYDRNTPSFKFKPFKIRIYFEWYEGENELMDDDQDTQIGNIAAIEDTKLMMNAQISFEQSFE